MWKLLHFLWMFKSTLNFKHFSKYLSFCSSKESQFFQVWNDISVSKIIFILRCTIPLSASVCYLRMHWDYLLFWFVFWSYGRYNDVLTCAGLPSKRAWALNITSREQELFSMRLALDCGWLDCCLSKQHLYSVGKWILKEHGQSSLLCMQCVARFKLAINYPIKTDRNAHQEFQPIRPGSWLEHD